MTRPLRFWQTLSIALLVALALLLRAEYAGATSQVFIFKPLATALVIAQLLPLALQDDDWYARLVLGGLALSFVGDVALMIDGTPAASALGEIDPFVAGLAAFLSAHLFYVAAFTRDGGFSWSTASARGLALLGAVLLALLWPALGALRLPVLAYMLVILTMAWQALERSRLGAHDGAWWAAVGAVLFVASDAALALARFRGEFPGAAALVLGTYYLAQWMIATSALVRAGRLAR